MGESTEIGWTSHSWNPWQGCEKISPGCANCYMFRDKRRFGQDPEVVVRSRPATFDAPLRWSAAGERGLVFTCSWSDWFHRDADPWRAEAWGIVRRTALTYQILTKRHGRIAGNLPPDWGAGYPNAWLGVSVESQDWLRRWETLARVPAALRFLSIEPLLGPVDAAPALYPTEVLHCPGCGHQHVDSPDPESGWTNPPHHRHLCHACGLVWDAGRVSFGGVDASPAADWVIVGGESGGDERREADPQWIEDVARACITAGVPVFVKQDSGPRPGQRGRLSADAWALKQIPPIATGAAP